MGHLIFIVLHVVLVLFVGAGGLIVTIPLHLIYAVLKGKAGPVTSEWTHVRCPDCAELVLNEARVCKHCGCKLIPASEQKRLAKESSRSPE